MAMSREEQLARKRAKNAERRSDPAVLAEEAARQRQRLADPEYRANRNARRNQRRAEDAEYRETLNTRKRQRRTENAEWRDAEVTKLREWKKATGYTTRHGAERRAINRGLLFEWMAKQGGCARCDKQIGPDDNLAELLCGRIFERDHINPADAPRTATGKRRTPLSLTPDQFKRDLASTQLLCRTCHDSKTAADHAVGLC